MAKRFKKKQANKVERKQMVRWCQKHDCKKKLIDRTYTEGGVNDSYECPKCLKEFEDKKIKETLEKNKLEFEISEGDNETGTDTTETLDES